jgi:large subunit ribosomal protein L30
MAKIKIMQVRSRIGCTLRQKNTLDALGLHKLNNPVIVEGTPQIHGMVRKVSHLVKVEEV